MERTQQTGYFASVIAIDSSDNMVFPANISAKQLISSVAEGTAPLVVISTTLVTNLNADLLDGNHASAFALSGHNHNGIYQPLLTNPVTGTGTSGYLPKWTGTTTQGNSLVFENGTNVGIGTTSPTQLFELSKNVSGGIGSVLNLVNPNSAANSAVELRLSPSAAYSSRYASIQAINFTGNNDIGIAFITGLGATVTEKARFTSDGNLLIGTTTSTSDKLLVNGTVSATQYKSSIATGTSPLSVVSTTLVTNLNADLLDGQHGSYYQVALTNPVSGTGTSGYIPRWTGTTSQANSVIYTDGTNVGIGTTTLNNRLTIAGDIFIGADTISRSAFQTSHNTSYYRTIFDFKRSRGTLAAPTSVMYEDKLGDFYFNGYDGATWQQSASFSAVIDGAVSANVVPAALSFWTSVNTTANLTERMRISSSGKVFVFDLASSSAKIVFASSAGQFGALGDGTGGQVLTTDGSGGYYWSTVSGGGGFPGFGTTHTSAAYGDHTHSFDNYTGWILSYGGTTATVASANNASYNQVNLNNGDGISVVFTPGAVNQVTHNLNLTGLTTIVNPTPAYYIPVTGGSTNTKITIATLASLIGAGLPDAPTDGNTYGRRNATWVAISGGGGTTIHSSLSNLDYDSSGHSGFARLAGSSSQAFAASTLTCSSTATATNFILSDKRLKENITRLKSLDKFDALNWYNFELISDKGHKRYGVIAQELEHIAPELVKENDQGMKMVNYIDLLVAKIARLEELIKEMKGISKCRE